MLSDLIKYINDISQGNDMIAGALMLVITGTLSYCLTRLPIQLFSLIKKQFITTLTFNNTDWHKQETFTKVTGFLQKLSTQTGTRTLVLETSWLSGKRILVLTMGFGKHFFWYKNRFMWLERSKLESSGGDKLKEEITISSFGRKHEIFYELLKDNQPAEDLDKIGISVWEEGDWNVESKIPKRSLDTLALDADVKDKFIKEIDHFLNNKDTYYKLGLPHKITFILEGKTGTGKTSIIRSIASEYGLNLCTLPLNSVGDKGFRSAIAKVPANSIILIEDFDASGVLNKRKGMRLEGEEIEESDGDPRFSFLTLSGVLNALDGIASLDGVIIFMTTNCINQIDPAMLRSGRVDHIINLPDVSGKTVKNYFEKIYDFEIEFEVPAMVAKDVHAIKFAAKDNGEIAIKLLEEKSKVA